jgi:DNA-binding winged helix-turn-helix (wHTH) protein
MRIRFGDFTLDLGERRLRCGAQERHLEPKAFELLDLLLSRRPEAVSKAEIRDRLWPDTFVAESNLTSLVSQLRATLGDRERRLVRTVHRFGYAFAGEARKAREEGPTAGVPLPLDSATARIVWEARELPLAEGENVLGRDPDLPARIDHPQISRRHARIVLRGRRATVEDLGSKNGTFVRDERIEGPVSLSDGETFRLGRQVLIFHLGSRPDSTRTQSAE